MRAFSSFIKNLLKSILAFYLEHNAEQSETKICYRCKVNNPEQVKLVCLNCNKVKYCNENCKKKNAPLHFFVCNMYLDHYPVINEIMKGMLDNYDNARGMEKYNKE